MLFETADLLSKWGFGDGDMLYDFKVEHDLKVNSATLLVEVVKRYVLPELRRHHPHRGHHRPWPAQSHSGDRGGWRVRG